MGSSELAAMNLIMPLSLCFTAIAAIFGIGSSIYIPVLKGKLDPHSADKCLTLSCLAWIVCSMITVCLGIFATNPIAAFLAGSSGLQEYVAEYLKVYLIGSPFTFITMIFPHIIRSDGKPKLASNVLIIANVTNLVLDVVFMKFVGMGLAGGALASICGYALGSFLYLSYVFSKGRTLHLSRIKAVDFCLYWDMIKYSISSILGQGFMFAKLWIFNRNWNLIPFYVLCAGQRNAGIFHADLCIGRILCCRTSCANHGKMLWNQWILVGIYHE